VKLVIVRVDRMYFTNGTIILKTIMMLRKKGNMKYNEKEVYKI